MKKHALILALLSVSLINNCMEQEKTIIITSPDKRSSIVMKTNGIKCDAAIFHAEAPIFCTKPSPSTQLTAKAQEKISLEPKIVFSLKDEEVQKLRALLIQKDRIQSNKTELFKILSNAKGPIVGKQSIIENLIDLEHQDINLNKQLNIHLTPEDERLLNNLDNEMKQVTNQIKNQTSNRDEFVSHTTSIINQLMPLYRKAEAIQTFIENKLMKSESGKLFIIIKENCQSHIDVLTQTINNLTEGIDNLTEISPQEQTSDK